MRKVDESYQPVEPDRTITPPPVRVVAIVGATALVVSVALLWWVRSRGE